MTHSRTTPSPELGGNEFEVGALQLVEAAAAPTAPDAVGPVADTPGLALELLGHLALEDMVHRHDRRPGDRHGHGDEQGDDRGRLVELTLPAVLKILILTQFIFLPKEFQSLNEPLEGGFDGIGVQFNMQNDTIVVINPVKGPSERLGVLPGDRIIKINGKNVVEKIPY